jgi:hypothetical protein
MFARQAQPDLRQHGSPGFHLGAKATSSGRLLAAAFADDTDSEPRQYGWHLICGTALVTSASASNVFAREGRQFRLSAVARYNLFTNRDTSLGAKT